MRRAEAQKESTVETGISYAAEAAESALGAAARGRASIRREAENGHRRNSFPPAMIKWSQGALRRAEAQKESTVETVLSFWWTLTDLNR